MRRILVVEDSEDFQLMIKKAILKPEVDIDVAPTVQSAMDYLKKNNYDLIILDLHLPDSDGFDLLIQLRKSIETQDVPVIFVTGAIDVENKVTAFSLGAEDYISKPFHPLELRARIEAKLKRLENAPVRNIILKFRSISIDPVAHRAYVGEANPRNELDLTHLEFKLIHHLVRHAEKVFTRQELLESVWGNTIHVSNRTVDVHICELRKKLGNLGHFIESVSGTGYRLSESAKTKKKAA